MMNSEDPEVSVRLIEVVELLSSLTGSLAQVDAIFSYLQTDLAGRTAVQPRARALLGAGQELSGLALDLAEERARHYQTMLPAEDDD